MTLSLKHSLLLFILSLSLVSCQGSFSTLAPAGDAAHTIAELFWWMVGGGTIIWLIFTSILFYALIRPRPHNARRTSFFIIGGGVIFPVVVLTVLLYFSLKPLPQLLAPAPSGSLTIEVTGLQWWWRVKYQTKDGEKIELANEIRLPVNQPVQFILTSADVIHSFWIPSLAGKMDMIPGHQTQLSLRPTKTGTYGGVCAEFCGTSHTLMQLKVQVMEPDKFQAWLQEQAAPARKSMGELAGQGEQAFKSNGCLACHSVRGVGEVGVLGPDLTHVGSRLSLAAGILPNNKMNLHDWITHAHKIKPDVKMPDFNMLPEKEREAIAHWLEGLK